MIRAREASARRDEIALTTDTSLKRCVYRATECYGGSPPPTQGPTVERERTTRENEKRDE